MKAKRARGTGSVYKPERSQFWWIAFYQNGKLIRESTKTDNKTKAQSMLTKRLQEVNSGNFTPDADKITVADIYKFVLSDYESGGKGGTPRPSLGTLRGRWHTDHSGRDRKGTRTTLREFFGHLRCSQVTTALLERYKAIRLDEGALAGSVNRELNVIKTAFNHAIRKTDGNGNPVLRTKPAFPKTLDENVKKDFITDTEYVRLASACTEVGGLWLRALLEAAYTFGNRKNELLKLKVYNVNLKDRFIELFPNETKTDKGRFLPIEDDNLFQMIEACMEGKTNRYDYVFTRNGKFISDFRCSWISACIMAGVGRMVCLMCAPVVNRTCQKHGLDNTSLLGGKRVCLKCAPTVENHRCPNCGVAKEAYDGVSFHGMRRSAVTAMIDAGMSEKEAMDISGHRSRSTFNRYNIESKARSRKNMHIVAETRARNLKTPVHSHIIHTAPEPAMEVPNESRTSKSIQ